MSRPKVSFIPRTANNIYTKLEARKAELIDDLQALLAERELTAEITQSPPYSGDIWVQVRYMTPRAGSDLLHDRTIVGIDVEGRELHRYPFQYTVTLERNETVRTLRGVAVLDRPGLAKLVDHIAADRKLSRIRLRRFRVWPLQVWRPRNKIAYLSNSPVAMLGYRIRRITGTVKRGYVMTMGKPLQEPRTLQLVDSWQTAISEAGLDAEDLGKRIRLKLEQASAGDIQVDFESIWYWGLDGKVERDQLVVTSNRGIAFVHVHPFGRDLYVGWDSHVNFGTWVEQDVTSGIFKETGDFVTAKRVVPGISPVSEYDVQEVVSLAEWCHSVVTKQVKILVREREIDQDIDYAILHERRADLTREKPGAKDGSEGMLGRFKRRK